jgi:hypothetical protein
LNKRSSGIKQKKQSNNFEQKQHRHQAKRASMSNKRSRVIRQTNKTNVEQNEQQRTNVEQEKQQELEQN